MEPIGKLIRVTPQEMQDILARLEAEGATRLAVLGPHVALSFNQSEWPESLRGQLVYQLGEPWPNLVDNVIRLRQLTRLVLWALELDETGARKIAQRLTKLTSLEVRNNDIGETGARAIAESLTQLTSLDASFNTIGQGGTRAIAKHLTQLTSLNVENNEIGDAGVRAIAECLTRLTSLDVSFNTIGQGGTRAIAEHLTQLTSLNVGSNQIGDAGARAIAECLTQLTSLDISNNNVGEPGARAIAERLTQLTSLEISNNSIGETGARAIAGRLTQLNSLSVSYNDIGEAGARAIAKHLPQLTSLDLSGNNIGEAGALAIAERLARLTSLFVWGSGIGDAGARAIAERLTDLTSLFVSNNNIGEAGARAIAERLTRLQSLLIADNNIGAGGVCAIAENLTQLNTLWAENNNIGDGGAAAIAKRMAQLDDLRLDDNDLGPMTIGLVAMHLRNLTQLSLAKNKDICDIGPLAHLRSLRCLNVAQTSVSDLAPFADRITAGWPVVYEHYFSASGSLNVFECPLVRPTVEIAQQGPEAVRNYFRELAEQGEDHLYEAKLLILGEGGVGKTSLLRRLYQPERDLPAEEETTRGIDIHRHDFIGNHGQPFRLNVWDFGGQQIYHATHQFFLTKNSLYILVDDTRKDDKTIHDEGFKFWLEVVETLSEGSPLLVFQNEKGGRSKNLDATGIQARFNNVKGFYSGNLDRSGTVEALQKAIECFVQQLPHIGEAVPKKWLAIRAELERIAVEKPFISQDDYFAVYGRHLSFDRTKALHLSRYLHDLGVFLHFQDDPLLSKTVILQNQWATEAVFRVLDDETIKGARGRFTADDCRRLWAASSYADMHFELRGLMEKFELCYRLAAPAGPRTGEQWLAPQLLSPSKPGELANWARPDDLVLRFRYPFLPRGLVSRLMVRQHRFVRQLDNCWAHGACFQHDGTEVLVEETTRGNEIELRARGPEHKALLSVLSSDLEALNETFKGLHEWVDKLVPCICTRCRQTTEPEMFEEKLLVQRKHSGKKKTIECRKSEEDVSLFELLDGLKPEHLPQWAARPGKPESDAEIARVAAPALRTVRIFLASSAELREDRDAFDLHFRQQNDHFKEQGVYLEIVRWEHFEEAMSDTRLQDEYNDELRSCAIVVSLFKTKVGKFTEEEFDVAWAAFKEDGSPRIYTYFRKFSLSSDEIQSKRADLDSLEKFQRKLTDLGHFPTTYADAEHLKRHFRDQLTKLGIVK